MVPTLDQRLLELLGFATTSHMFVLRKEDLASDLKLGVGATSGPLKPLHP